MLTEQIRLVNIAGFRDTTIDYRGHPFFAVVAPNETGKSYLVGAMIAALWGFWPSKNKSLFNHITWGQTRGEITAIVSFCGKR